MCSMDFVFGYFPHRWVALGWELKWKHIHYACVCVVVVYGSSKSLSVFYRVFGETGNSKWCAGNTSHLGVENLTRLRC